MNNYIVYFDILFLKVYFAILFKSIFCHTFFKSIFILFCHTFFKSIFILFCYTFFKSIYKWLVPDLRGVNRDLSRDCLGKDNYKNYNVPNQPIQYPTCSDLTTAQSRATNPAWWYRDLEQVAWEYPPLNPQVNTCIPFQNNLSTRVLEKDYFTPKRDCVVNETKNYLPTSFELIRGGYVGGPTTCQQRGSCENV